MFDSYKSLKIERLSNLKPVEKNMYFHLLIFRLDRAKFRNKKQLKKSY